MHESGGTNWRDRVNARLRMIGAKTVGGLSAGIWGTFSESRKAEGYNAG